MISPSRLTEDSSRTGACWMLLNVLLELNIKALDYFTSAIQFGALVLRPQHVTFPHFASFTTPLVINFKVIVELGHCCRYLRAFITHRLILFQFHLFESLLQMWQGHNCQVDGSKLAD